MATSVVESLQFESLSGALVTVDDASIQSLTSNVFAGSQVYAVKDTGSVIKIVTGFSSLTNMIITVQGRMGPNGSWRDLSVTSSNQLFTVARDDKLREIRVRLQFTSATVVTFTEPAYIGEV